VIVTTLLIYNNRIINSKLFWLYSWSNDIHSKSVRFYSHSIPAIKEAYMKTNQYSLQL